MNKVNNPKLDPGGKVKKEPEEWLSGDDPMTPAQASYLKTLCEQAGNLDSFDEHLTKAEASQRIDALREQLNLIRRGQK